MATDRVRAATRRINRLHQRFAGCFRRKDSQFHSQVYLRGLMLAEGRKNAEAIASGAFPFCRGLLAGRWSAGHVTGAL